MFYKKKGTPEVNEIVICTVKKILPHSIFVNLDEYDKEAMLHISEVAPGRIRNIRDFIKDNKRIICKILNINQEKGHIDLSLRRVNLAQKRNKISEYKQEEKSEKLLEQIARELKLDLRTLYEEAGNKLIEEYGTLAKAFQEIVDKDIDLKNLNIKKNIAQKIIELVKLKIKPQEVTISGTIKLQCNKENGIEIIKSILKKIKDNNINIHYIGAPNYRIIIKAPDYKIAESKLKEIINTASTDAKKLEVSFEFIRK